MLEGDLSLHLTAIGDLQRYTHIMNESLAWQAESCTQEGGLIAVVGLPRAIRGSTSHCGRWPYLQERHWQDKPWYPTCDTPLAEQRKTALARQTIDFTR